jgi:hypothetical protein
MRKFIGSAAIMALVGTLTFANPRQDRDDHHQGRDDRRERDDRRDKDDHHDNGKHKGWDKHGDRGDYRNWDDDHDRIKPGRAYPYGRYEHVRDEFIARRIDFRTRRVVLYDNSNWVVASYDLDRCRDWEWDRDRVFVYDDDHHPGWYLLFNARLGRYVHVEYSGVR